MVQRKRLYIDEQSGSLREETPDKNPDTGEDLRLTVQPATDLLSFISVDFLSVFNRIGIPCSPEIW